ncbi:hypothetical protein [uncultured Paludibaculum sp.]|uniref:hypothetical protein n=1 Tax=uncultured Paludibaculum sp. TaxID=1765020 RepID=UPI002AAA8E4C|nr:hypothetical protein [uncultured Paludibaculum sp.]
MVRANAAEVFWDTDKKTWVVRIQVGGEAVRRTCKGTPQNADEAALHSLALQTAQDEGYELAETAVSVRR